MPSTTRLPIVVLASALVLVAGTFTVPVARLPFAGLFTLYAYRPVAGVVLVVLAVLTALLAMRGVSRWPPALAAGAAYLVVRTAWQVHRDTPPERTSRAIDAITGSVPGALSAQWGLLVLAIAALGLLAGALLAEGVTARLATTDDD